MKALNILLACNGPLILHMQLWPLCLVMANFTCDCRAEVSR